MAQPPIIQVRDLHKRFGSIHAVRGISFDVATGTCLGLLGHNGAGKTTTVEMLEGITRPDSGSIRYKGRPLDKSLRDEAGIMFQHTALQDFQTVHEALSMFAALYKKKASVDELTELCHLQDFLHRDTRKLSGGQRQRLLLAIALINDPELVFLDEPTTGLHFDDISKLLKCFHQLIERGHSLIVIEHDRETMASSDWIVDMGPGAGEPAQPAPTKPRAPSPVK